MLEVRECSLEGHLQGIGTLGLRTLRGQESPSRDHSTLV